MDQIKIGKFISECRKKENLTQMQLAKKLNITDRAVSKWENGKSMPDSSIMLELCGILKITVNDLLCGEIVSLDNYSKELEKNLIEMAKAKEDSDKRLLICEIIIGFVCTFFALAACVIAGYVPMEDWLRIVLIFAGLIPLVISVPFMLKIEQIAGYYMCAKCGHKYVPTLKAVNLAPHVGRTRHMKCPKCGEKSWHKKVLNRD